MKKWCLFVLLALLLGACQTEQTLPTPTVEVVELLSPMEIEYQVPISWGEEECEVFDRVMYLVEYCSYGFESIPFIGWISAQRYSSPSFAKQALSAKQHSLAYNDDQYIVSGSYQESEIELCGSTAFVYQYIDTPHGDIINNSQSIDVVFVIELTLYDFDLRIDLVETEDPDSAIEQVWETIESIQCP